MFNLRSRFKSLSLNRVLVFLLSTLLTGCATPVLYSNSRVSEMADEALFLLLPSVIHGLAGDRMAKEWLLYRSFVDAFADRGLSSERLNKRRYQIDFVELSWQMSHAMQHLVTVHDSYDYGQAYTFGDSGHSQDRFYQLDIELSRLAQLLRSDSQLAVRPDYLALIHIDSLGVSAGGEQLKYRVVAGIYSLPQQRLERVLSLVQQTPDQALAIEHDLDILGMLVYRQLFELD